MFSIFSNKKLAPMNVILDIQSGLVRGALLMTDQVGETHIVDIVTKSYSGKTNIINSDHLIKKNLKLIAEVVEYLSRQTNGSRITSINYLLSSPWIFSKLKSIKVDYKKDIIVNHKIIGDLVKDEIKESKTNSDTAPIEQKIFEIRLNGYPTTDFDGKIAHLIEMSISTSFSSKKFLDKVNNVVDKHLHVKNHIFHSALLMQYNALRTILDNKNEYIYIHVHSELTDIVIVKSGQCRHIASFPFGISTLIRKVASITKQNMESSDSMLSLYQGNKLNENQKNEFQQNIIPLIQQWGETCIKSFGEVFDFTNIPRTIYLSAHSHFDIFKQAMIYQNSYNFEVIPYDDVNNVDGKIIFDKGVYPSNLIKLYTIALNNNF